MGRHTPKSAQIIMKTVHEQYANFLTYPFTKRKTNHAQLYFNNGK